MVSVRFCPLSLKRNRLIRESSLSTSSNRSPDEMSLRSIRLTLDFSRRRRWPRSRAVMSGHASISIKACTADGGRSVPAKSSPIKPSSRTSWRDEARIASTCEWSCIIPFPYWLHDATLLACAVCRKRFRFGGKVAGTRKRYLTAAGNSVPGGDRFIGSRRNHCIWPGPWSGRWR